MYCTPSYDAFVKRYHQGQSLLVTTELAGDLTTALHILLSLCCDDNNEIMRNSFLLESVINGESTGRYSIIGFMPDVIWRYKHDKAQYNFHADAPDGGYFEDCPLPPLDSLKQFIDNSQIDHYPDGLPDVAAGIFGYLGYETIHHIEHIKTNSDDILQCDDGIYFRPKIIAVLDQTYHRLSLVTPVYYHDNSNPHDVYEEACALLSRMADRLTRHQHFNMSHNTDITIDSDDTITQNMTHDDYLNIVAKAKEYILNGDIFQTVLSLRFMMNFSANPINLYRQLRATNPSPYMFFMRLYDDTIIVGSSPEILVRINDNTVSIRPIAGTRRRGISVKEDRHLEHELLHDEKELAEHLMLLDLGRNDVGRISKIGTVNVEDSFFIERYSHVMHIVSHVTGKLHDDYHILDALVAGFPAGTVSGAPKIRAMEIINELEPHQRGIYAGCLGYFTSNGNMDNCITLRTAIIKDKKLYVQAGAGIVADSIPENEYQECVNKAKVILETAKKTLQHNYNN